MSDSDDRLDTGAVMEFEGEFVRVMEGRLPQITLDMPEGYRRDTHLKLELEVRVRNVNFTEVGKSHDLARVHTFALEAARLVGAFDPALTQSGVGGNASGNWQEALLAYARGETTTVEYEGDRDELPARVQLLIEESELREAYGQPPLFVTDPDADEDQLELPTAEPADMVEAEPALAGRDLEPGF